MFLLSPASLAGARAAIVFNPSSTLPLMRELHTRGAPLGALFSFVSSLYFRGKNAYANAFGRPPPGVSAGLIITPGEGLQPLEELVSVNRLRGWAEIDIDAREPRFTAPLVDHAAKLARAHGATTRFVLLGSVATDKYVGPLGAVFGDDLLFPPDFVGRGDMSRGGLMLRAAEERRELDYAPIAGALRHGQRPARLPRKTR